MLSVYDDRAAVFGNAVNTAVGQNLAKKEGPIISLGNSFVTDTLIRSLDTAAFAVKADASFESDDAKKALSVKIICLSAFLLYHIIKTIILIK